jgi:hypothetical protein
VRGKARGTIFLKELKRLYVWKSKGSTDARGLSNEIKDSARLQIYKNMEVKIYHAKNISLKRDNCC